MQVSVIPAAARTSQATIRTLLSHPSEPTVKGVYRDTARAPEEFKSHPRFEAIQGDMKDASSLNFDGSDAVVVTIPPIRDENTDVTANTKAMTETVKTAVKNAPSVKRLVLVSTKGAQYDHGLGEVLSTLHNAEQILRDAALEVAFIRCAYFMENWASSMKTIEKGKFFYSAITPLDWAMPMVAIKDIGAVCAETAASAQSLGENPYIVELHGPRAYSAMDVKKAFEELVGTEVQVKGVGRDGLLGFFSAVFPGKMAKRFADMMLAATPGGIMAEDPSPTGRVQKGMTELVEVLREV